MIKIVGFAVIVSCCAKIGFDFSKKYSDRTRELKELVSILERLKNEISFSNSVITDALLNSVSGKNGAVSKLMLSVAEYVRSNRCTFSDALSSVLKEETVLSLNNCDIEELCRFFNMAGSGDREDEVKNINNSITNLNMLLYNSADDEKKYVKLFRTTGILAGFLIAIILA